MDLGRIGVWVSPRALGAEHSGRRRSSPRTSGTARSGSAARRACWSCARCSTRRREIVVGTSIVNIWAYEPADLAAEFAELAPDFAERLLVGIGVGHPEATGSYATPLTAMREFLDGLDAADP